MPELTLVQVDADPLHSLFFTDPRIIELIPSHHPHVHSKPQKHGQRMVVCVLQALEFR